MAVTNIDVKKVSHLARIEIEDSKLDELCNGLNCILNFVDQLNEVDNSKIDNDDCQHHASSMPEREDVVKICDPAVMNNAPQKECNMFVVPKVIG
jgi:aspartyl-tRNA(Asn)/glutamyl-tRNA(Gln) amidotransferase subunit C